MANPNVLSSANNTRNFIPKKGDWIQKRKPIIASVAMVDGSALYYTGAGTGTLTKVTNATGNFAGILAEPIATTDADFAVSGKLKAVWIPIDVSSECEFKVGAGNLVAADVGENVKFFDELSVDVDTAGTQVTIKGVIVPGDASVGRGICTFNQAIS